MGLLNIENQNAELKKHVAIIHCLNTLTLLQRKISNALLYHAYSNLQLHEEHEISIKQLCNIIGYSGNNHSVIKTALKGLLSTIVEWDVIDNITGEEDWTASTVLASVRIKGSHCTYAYSPRMRALLHLPSMYGKINLYIQARFKSSYGLALYENCIRYRGLPYTRWFDLNIFRKLMGVPENLYPVFRDLKKRVLEKSVEEVNLYSDINVEAEINRVGHKVNSIRFIFKNVPKKNVLGHNLSGDQKADTNNNMIHTENDDIVKLMNNKFGVKKEMAENLLSEFGILHISRAIKVVETSSSYLKGKINNLAAYLIKAIKEDYELPKQSSLDFNIVSIDEREKTIIDIKSENFEYELQKKYSAYLFECIDSKISSLDDYHKEMIYKNFEIYLNTTGNESIFSQYKKEGLQRAMMKGLFNYFIKEQYSGLIIDFLSFEDFKKFNLHICC